MAKTAAAMRGDREAAAALWQEHRRWIAAVILAYKPRSLELDDLLQEVAMTLVAKINTLREEGNVRAWLRMVAINAARAAGRSERSRPALRLADWSSINQDRAEVSGGSAGHLESSDEAQRIMALTSRLPDMYREPLILKALHGMRTRQIGEILDLSEATVDTRISRARRMLRELDDAGRPPSECPVPVSLAHDR